MPFKIRLEKNQRMAAIQAKNIQSERVSPPLNLQEMYSVRRLSKGTDRLRKNSPARSYSKNKKTTLFTAFSTRALLKKAREVDLNDPTHTFLPPKVNKLWSRAKQIEQQQINKQNKKLSVNKQKNEQKNYGNYGRVFKKYNKADQKQNEQSNKGSKVQIEETADLMERQGDEMNSLSKIIFFGDGGLNEEDKIILKQQQISYPQQLMSLIFQIDNKVQ